MSAHTWFIIYISAFSISAVLFITAVILFIKLNIPVIIGDLSGRTAQKQIRMIRDSNAAENSQKQIPGIYNSTHRLGTGKSPSVKFEGQAGRNTKGSTGDISARRQHTGDFSDRRTGIVTEELGNKTELLNPDHSADVPQGTVALSETSANYQGSCDFPDGTSEEGFGSTAETTLLSPEQDKQQERRSTSQEFHVITSIIVIHCNEVIE